MIKRSLLKQWVQNTAPFIRVQDVRREGFIAALNGIDPADDSLATPRELFAAHFCTVGTFVPTDVDQAIREKIWRQKTEPNQRYYESADVFEAFFEFTSWSELQVSKRYISDPVHVSGHHGEILSVLPTAYATAQKIGMGAHKKKCLDLAHKIMSDHIQALALHFENVFGVSRVDYESGKVTEEETHLQHRVARVKPLMDLMAIWAHNFGDFKRGLDLNKIDENDDLYKIYAAPLQTCPRSVRALEEFYKLHLAQECHRHLALRQPKVLRQSADYLLGFGPFLESWGETLARAYQHGHISDPEFREIIWSLVQGWDRLRETVGMSVGYGRALRGMGIVLSGEPSSVRGVPEGKKVLANFLSPKEQSVFTESGVRKFMDDPIDVVARRYAGALEQVFFNRSN